MDPTQGEAGSAEHEQPGQDKVEAGRFYAHSNSGAGTRCRGSIRATRFAPERFAVFRLLLVVTYSGYHAPPASSVLG
jgi:hypothetical protein